VSIFYHLVFEEHFFVCLIFVGKILTHVICMLIIAFESQEIYYYALLSTHLMKKRISSLEYSQM